MRRRCICFQEVCQDGPGNVSGTSSQVGSQIKQERYLVKKGSGSQFEAGYNPSLLGNSRQLKDADVRVSSCS